MLNVLTLHSSARKGTQGNLGGVIVMMVSRVFAYVQTHRLYTLNMCSFL